MNYNKTKNESAQEACHLSLINHMLRRQVKRPKIIINDKVSPTKVPKALNHYREGKMIKGAIRQHWQN